MSDVKFPRELTMQINSFFRTVALAGATSALSWFIMRALSARDRAGARPPRRHVEQWENEGGALAPQPGLIKTSQVPR